MISIHLLKARSRMKMLFLAIDCMLRDVKILITSDWSNSNLRTTLTATSSLVTVS
jgi:hypothetical protein